MPSHNDFFKIFGIVAFTFIESYFLPFAILKWIIMVVRVSGFLTRFAKYKATESEKKRFQFKYNLQLLTCGRNSSNELVYINSSVNVVINNDDVQLSYCGQDCKRIPPALQKMYGSKVKYLDLSYNSIETLKGLELFVRLEELILDNNQLTDGVAFPNLPYLRTLSLNNNQFSDLEGLVNRIKEHFPSVSYLSLLCNKACPNQLSDVDKDDSDYQRYRYYMIYTLPTLRFLDSRRVTSTERKEAAMRGEFTRVRRPPESSKALLEVPTSTGTQVRPLPVDLTSLGKHKGAYGKCVYKYTGKHSEGNRFIRNNDL